MKHPITTPDALKVIKSEKKVKFSMYIFISDESVSLLVYYSITASPAQTVGSIHQFST